MIFGLSYMAFAIVFYSICAIASAGSVLCVGKLEDKFLVPNLIMILVPVVNSYFAICMFIMSLAWLKEKLTE